MKSCATGVSVRFFNVTIPTGLRMSGISVDRGATAMPQPANLNVASEMMLRNRPPGDKSEARGTVGHHCGGREFESRRPKGFGVQRALRALGRRQRPRLVHQIGNGIGIVDDLGQRLVARPRLDLMRRATSMGETRHSRLAKAVRAITLQAGRVACLAEPIAKAGRVKA
jgi:hypothetical protein